MADWEKIGDWTPVSTNTDHVPRWVIKALRKVNLDKYGSWGGRVKIKGKHYEYMIDHSQHGTYCTFYKRKRHR